MNELKVFSFEANEVRTVMINNEPWFVLKDVCGVLDIENSRNVSARLDEDEKAVHSMDTPSGVQEMTIINESGIYNVVMRSDKPQAKPFRKWVTSDVLPTIRKTGGYVNNDDLFINTYLPFADDNTKSLFKLQLEVNRKAAVQIAEMKPKAEFFDQVTDSTDAIDMGIAAKTLNVGIGRTKLFAFLRDKKVLQRNNIPYQEYCDRGYFRVIESTYTRPDGSHHVNFKTVVYQKGLDYIRKLLKQYKGEA